MDIVGYFANLSLTQMLGWALLLWVGYRGIIRLRGFDFPEADNAKEEKSEEKKMNAETIECRECNNEFDKSDVVYFDDLDIYLCKKCIDEGKEKCPICGKEIMAGAEEVECNICGNSFRGCCISAFLENDEYYICDICMLKAINKSKANTTQPIIMSEHNVVLPQTYEPEAKKVNIVSDLGENKPTSSNLPNTFKSSLGG